MNGGQRNSPAVENGAAEDRVDGRSLTNNSTNDAFAVVQRTDAEEKYLAGWARGWDAATDFLLPRLQRAERDADLWYERAHNPVEEKRSEIVWRRMAQADEQYWDLIVNGEVAL